MESVQTLHEFAVNLLCDPQALADFDADPRGALCAAGLGEVNAADVREILPLVLDTSVTEAPGAGGVPTLDGAVATGVEVASPLVTDLTQVVSRVLGDLPNLSGVFGAVSEVADETGLSHATVGTLHTVSDVAHGVAGTLDDVALVGPLVDAGDIDLQNTVGALADHESDDQLVGAAVDAFSNHLGDALLWQTAVTEVGELPGVGGPLGGRRIIKRVAGGGAIGVGNEAVGSTPVGVHSGQALAAEYGGGDFNATGDLADTLDHVTSAVPAAPALHAVPFLPAIPALGDAVHSVADTVVAGPAHVPFVGGVGDTAPGGSGLTGIHHDVSTLDAHVASVVNGVDSHVQCLTVGHLADGLDAHGADAAPSTDDIHLLGH